MGVPVPPPPVIGSPCHYCDNILWHPGQTPKFVHATISGVEACPLAPYPAPNGSYILEQHPADPCQWFYGDPYHLIKYWTDDNDCGIDIYPSGMTWLYYFMARKSPGCQTHFENQLEPNCSGFNVGRYGTIDLEF